MGKFEKEQQIPKPADLKKIDPIDKTKKSRHKKKFPPHWEIRVHGIYGNNNGLKNRYRYYISASKFKVNPHDWEWNKTKENNYFIWKISDEYKKVEAFLAEENLDAALEIYTKHHPETKDWPVRFINLQPMETTREVIHG